MNHGSLVTNQEIDILNQVWKSRTLAPRVKTFAWRLIRRAIDSALRASGFSKHIKKECCRCGCVEFDLHLFFLCTFSRSVWFKLGFKSDILDHNLYPPDVINLILSINHPDLNLEFIFTTLWNIWRPDVTFCLKR